MKNIFYYDEYQREQSASPWKPLTDAVTILILKAHKKKFHGLL